MYSRGGRLALVAGFILGMLSLLGAHARPEAHPPATITLKIPFSGSCPKAPVSFSHREHEARLVECTECHHEYQGRRNVWREGQPVKQCRTCHGLRPQPRRLDLKNAYHRQCKGCHLSLRQQGQPAGPVECRECHGPG